jgi:hypothetical protein
MLGGPHRMPIDVDGDEIGGRHLAVVKTEGIDQENCLRTEDPQADVVEDRLRPSQVIKDPIAGCESSSSLPLLLGNRKQTVTGARHLIHDQTLWLSGVCHARYPLHAARLHLKRFAPASNEGLFNQSDA